VGTTWARDPRFTISLVGSHQTTPALIGQLEAGRQSGCLTIESGDGLVCRVYLLMGKIFHASGPAGEGESALTDALSWSNVTLSFDEKAQLPDSRTITAGSSTTSAVTGPLASEPAAINKLSTDPRLFVMSCATLGGGCLWILVPLTLIGLGAVFHGNRAVSNSFFGTALIALPALLVVWLALHVGFRVMFYRDAVRVQGQLPIAEMPRVLDVPPGAISGQPELILKMQTRCPIGKLGKCWIELYENGLQISRGPQHPEPRWQFLYRDLLQAESVDVVSVGTKGGEIHQSFVRVITDQPRMAFLFGTNMWWLQNQKAEMLVNKLREHRVPTFTESLDT